MRVFVWLSSVFIWSHIKSQTPEETQLYVCLSIVLLTDVMWTSSTPSVYWKIARRETVGNAVYMDLYIKSAKSPVSVTANLLLAIEVPRPPLVEDGPYLLLPSEHGPPGRDVEWWPIYYSYRNKPCVTLVVSRRYCCVTSSTYNVNNDEFWNRKPYGFSLFVRIDKSTIPKISINGKTNDTLFFHRISCRQ